jgi:hypothetical protein
LDYAQRNGAANVQYKVFDLSKNYQGAYQGTVQGSGEGLGKGSGEVNAYHSTIVQIVSVFKTIRTDLTDETCKAEAMKLLAKNPALHRSST